MADSGKEAVQVPSPIVVIRIVTTINPDATTVVGLCNVIIADFPGAFVAFGTVYQRQTVALPGRSAFFGMQRDGRGQQKGRPKSGQSVDGLKTDARMRIGDRRSTDG